LDRSAIDTIRGYCYQFDKSILEVLSLECDTDSIEVEGIEDVDIVHQGELSAIQCKYYEKTSYNHSVIAKPIRLMLSHFSKNKDQIGNYHLFGHYKDGQEKLPTSITLTFLKDKFLTYTKDKNEYEEHLTLNLSDDDLELFLGKLTIDIKAKSFDKQYDEVIEKLINVFSCTKQEATHYYYNAAFSVITKLGCNHSNRKITKSEFINNLNNNEALFNVWLYKYKGRQSYLRKLKSDLFPRNLNTQSFDRFFILDASNAKNITEIKDCIYSIQKNWSNLSKRTARPYSPYIYIHNKEKEVLHSLKEQMFNEGLHFSDGYNFVGSKFCLSTLSQSKMNLNIKFQYVETETDLLTAVNAATSRVEIYQFFTNENDLIIEFEADLKNTKLQVLNFEDIKDLV
jgi:hypothetical protein